MNTTTRRAAMRGIAATAVATAALAIPAASASTTNVDAVLAAWRAWRPLAEEFARLSEEWTRIHKAAPEWVRNGPHIEIAGVQVHSPETVDRAMKSLPDWLKPASEQLRECAVRGWDEGWARVEAERVRIGLYPVQNRQDEITELQDPLIVVIENAGGSHPVVIAAKLDLALSNADDEYDLGDAEVAYIASAIRALLPELPADMAQSLAPIAAMEGTIRQIYTRLPATGGRAAS
jgi:hypothetical protein